MSLSIGVRQERSFECFSRGTELACAIAAHERPVPGDVSHHPRADQIMDDYDLNIFEWHYWRRIVTREDTGSSS